MPSHRNCEIAYKVLEQLQGHGAEGIEQQGIIMGVVEAVHLVFLIHLHSSLKKTSFLNTLDLVPATIILDFVTDDLYSCTREGREASP